MTYKIRKTIGRSVDMNSTIDEATKKAIVEQSLWRGWTCTEYTEKRERYEKTEYGQVHVIVLTARP